MTIFSWQTENGISLFMWIGLQVDPNWLHQAFGVQTIGQVDIEMVRQSDHMKTKGLLLLQNCLKFVEVRRKPLTPNSELTTPRFCQ